MVSPFPEHRTLRLALVSETFPPEINGVAMTLGRLVKGLVKRGHEVQVVRCRQPGNSDLEPNDGAEHLRLASVPIPRYQGLRLGLPCRSTLRAAWRSRRPDVVHVATEGPLGWSAVGAAKDLGIPLSSSFHTNFDDYAGHYGVRLVKRLVSGWLRSFHNQAQVTMVPSVDLAARLEQAGYRNLVTLGRGVDTGLFSPAKRSAACRAAWGAEPADPVFLHVGRVAPEKDIPLALETFAAIQARHPRARLVVVGDGPLRQKLTAGHPRVHFTGAVPVEDLAVCYASADAFLFPSRSETFGNVLLEAMASGLATVSFNYAAPRAYVHDGGNGLLAPFADPAAWRVAAHRLADEPELRRALGVAARETAEGIAWDPVIARFESLLRRVADRQPVVDPLPAIAGRTVAA